VLTGIQEGESTRGIKELWLASQWRRLGGVGRSIAARCGGDVIWVGRRKEDGGSDGWGLLGSDVRETKHRWRTAQTRWRSSFWQICQGCSGRVGRARARRPAGWSRPGLLGAGPESEEKLFPNKIWIFEYTLEICTRRFRRNFDMRIFSKFF
jgi:hypothetical protein